MTDHKDHKHPQSVYIAFAVGTAVALSDLVINGNIEGTKEFWIVALGYATVRQAIKSFGNK